MRHVIPHVVSILSDMVVCHKATYGLFGVLDILDLPVDGVLLGLLVDPEHEADQELPVTKYPDRELEVWSRVKQGL